MVEKTAKPKVCPNCDSEMVVYSERQVGPAAEGGPIIGSITRTWKCRNCGHTVTETVAA